MRMCCLRFCLGYGKILFFTPRSQLQSHDLHVGHNFYSKANIYFVEEASEAIKLVTEELGKENLTKKLYKTQFKLKSR